MLVIMLFQTLRIIQYFYNVSSLCHYKISYYFIVRPQACILRLSYIFFYKKGCTRLAAANDKVYQLHAHGRWFSPGTPASSITKTGCHDMAEILLKVALKHNKLNKINTFYSPIGETGTAYPSGAHEFTPIFMVFCVVFSGNIYLSF